MVFEIKFGFGSQLRVEKVLAPHKARLKTVPSLISLIKCAREPEILHDNKISYQANLKFDMTFKK